MLCVTLRRGYLPDTHINVWPSFFGFVFFGGLLIKIVDFSKGSPFAGPNKVNPDARSRSCTAFASSLPHFSFSFVLAATDSLPHTRAHTSAGRRKNKRKRTLRARTPTHIASHTRYDEMR